MALKQISLVTDDLELNDRDERLQLISNFKIIQKALNGIIDELEADENKDDGSSKFATNDDIDSLKDRINRITMGFDQETFENIVINILQQKGVID